MKFIKVTAVYDGIKKQKLIQADRIIQVEPTDIEPANEKIILLNKQHEGANSIICFDTREVLWVTDLFLDLEQTLNGK